MKTDDRLLAALRAVTASRKAYEEKNWQAVIDTVSQARMHLEIVKNIALELVENTAPAKPAEPAPTPPQQPKQPIVQKLPSVSPTGRRTRADKGKWRSPTSALIAEQIKHIGVGGYKVLPPMEGRDFRRFQSDIASVATILWGHGTYKTTLDLNTGDVMVSRLA